MKFKITKPTCALLILALFAGCKEDPEKQLAQVEAQAAARMEKIEQIKDPELHESAKEIAGIFEWLQKNEIESSIPPTETQYEDLNPGQTDLYSSPQDMMAAFITNTYVTKDSFSVAHVDHPFDLPIEHEMKWETLSLDNGETIDIKYFDRFAEIDPENIFGRKNDGTDPVWQGYFDESFDSVRIMKNGEQIAEHEMPAAVLLKGTFSAPIEAPSIKLEFDKSSIGKSQEADDFLITLKSIDGHMAIFTIEDKDGNPLLAESRDLFEVKATDESERFIVRSGSSSLPGKNVETFYDQFDTALDLMVKSQDDKGLLEELIVKIDGEGDNAPKIITKKYYFNGSIDKLFMSVTQATNEMFTQDIERSIVQMEMSIQGNAPQKIPMDAYVYDTGMAMALDLKPIELTREEISTKVTAEFEDDGFSEPQISFEYPEVLSDIFISGFDRFEYDDYNEGPEIKEYVEFFDEANEIIPTNRDEQIDWNVERIEIDFDAFKKRPVRAKGVAMFVRSLGVENQEYTLDNLPEGLSVDDNMLIVDYGNYGSVNGQIFVARGPEGHPLKQFHSQNVNDDDGLQLGATYYYGPVHSVEIVKNQGTELVPYHFDVEIPPLIDDDKDPADS